MVPGDEARVSVARYDCSHGIVHVHRFTRRRTGSVISVDADRLAAAGEIMSILRRRPSVRESISAQESGERPILVGVSRGLPRLDHLKPDALLAEKVSQALAHHSS